MCLHTLIALITLSSAAEDAPSVASLPTSTCEELYIEDGNSSKGESVLGLEHMDLTVLIIWEGQTQISIPNTYFFDFESRSLSMKNLRFQDLSKSVFGQVLSRGNERIYIPWADGNSSDDSRYFFESHLFSSINNFRLIVLFDPELSEKEMSTDSRLSLMRLFSLVNGTIEVNLVLAEDPGYMNTNLYNFTHHNAYIKQVFNSCSNCADHHTKRWLVSMNQVNKNFPSIRYRDISVKSVDNIARETDELDKLTCYLLRTLADAVWETSDNMQLDFSDGGGIQNLLTQVILTLRNESLHFKTYNQTPALQKPSEKLPPGQEATLVIPERKTKTLVNETEGYIIRDIKQVLEHYPGISGYLGDFEAEDENYYEYKLNETLQGIFLSGFGKKKLLTGVHNIDDLGQEAYSIPNAVISCLGDLMIVTGDNVTLNVQNIDCPFRALVVKASNKIELTKNFYMPGKNLLIHSPLVKSVGSHVINLSGKDCLEDFSGGDGGNFTIYMDKYEGKPLKIISNGGKGCSRLSEITASEVTRDVPSANDKDLPREINLTKTRGTNGKGGQVKIFSTNHDLLGEKRSVQNITKSNNNIYEGTNWYMTNRSEDARNDFLQYLKEREKIQIFINHVILDSSKDGSRIIDQVYILNNYMRPPEEHGMFGNLISNNTSSMSKWLVMQSDSSNLSQSLGTKSSPGECCPLTINNYDIECGVNLVKRKVSSLSNEVTRKLSNFPVRVINCSQIDLAFVSEFDLVLCNISTHENSNITYPLPVDEELTCYQTLEGSIVCHCKRNESNFDEITKLARDYALAILTIRHIQVNPLRMIRAPLTDFTLWRDNLDELNEIFRGTYKSLVRDLRTFYEEVVKPKARMVIAETRKMLFRSKRRSCINPGVADTLSWNLFITTEIIECTERFHYPNMLAELALPSLDTGSLQLLQNLKEKTIIARVTATAFYLKVVKSQLKLGKLPTQLKNNVSAILETYSKKINHSMDTSTEDSLMDGYNCSERGINLTYLSRLAVDFKEKFKTLEAGLSGEVLEPYSRTIGKFVRAKGKMLDIIQSFMSISKDREELESVLPYAFKFAEKTNKTFQSFDIHLELIRAFENAISEPDPYLNKLYAKILQNLNFERNFLTHLAVSNPEIGDLKSALETAFALELEVYRALQTVRRVEDIRSTYRKIIHSSEAFGSNTNAINEMHDVLQDSIASFVFETVQNDFEYRIYPFYENVTSSFYPRNLEASIEEIEGKLKKYKKYFERASFDPGTCNKSCQPFYVWSNQDIQRQGQDIQSFFQGKPLYLFAYPKNGFKTTVISNNFRIRFVSDLKKHEEKVNGTGVLLHPASFSYISFRNETHFTTVEDTFFEHVIGENPPHRRNSNSSLISPYTLWKIQLVNVSREFDTAAMFIKGIELVGEGEIVVDDNEGRNYVNNSKLEKWKYKEVYLTLL